MRKYPNFENLGQGAQHYLQGFWIKILKMSQRPFPLAQEQTEFKTSIVYGVFFFFFFHFLHLVVFCPFSLSNFTFGFHAFYLKKLKIIQYDF